MLPSPHDRDRVGAAPNALAPGLATGIGSLPHLDAAAATRSVLAELPCLPAAPQLPRRDAREGVVAQWASALPEVVLDRAGTITLDREQAGEPVDAALHPDVHGGLLDFLDTAAQAPVPPARVKVQVVGPLTLGVALHRAGLGVEDAFTRASAAVAAWVRALETAVTTRLPDAAPVLFFDEPALVLWQRHEAPLEREAAVDRLSSALVGVASTAGVHVCGDGDLRLAFEAGPRVLGVPVSDAVIGTADVIARHLDADGWVAWGAVPTDRPLGESADALWRRLVSVWCELTRRGCDGVRLRTQAIVTPACGLAGFGESQSVRAMRLARELATRIGDQAAAARLTVGA